MKAGEWAYCDTMIRIGIVWKCLWLVYTNTELSEEIGREVVARDDPIDSTVKCEINAHI